MRSNAAEVGHHGALLHCCIAGVVAAAAIGCGSESSPALAQLTEARRLSTSLLLEFTKASDAANRAVMADTDRASAEFAEEAKQAMQQVQRDAGTLEPILVRLHYDDERRLLNEVDANLTKYRALDGTVLGLAVENTNLKAQRLSFGSARAAADALRDALDSVARSEHANETWHVRALAATAVAAVREIEVLQAPHIAEAGDDAMTRLEKQMAAAQAEARAALEALASLVEPSSRPQLSAATSALDRFADLNAQIIRLSRRNTNVQSLALSLGEKRALTVAGERSLHALHDALAKRGFSGTR